MKELTPDQMRAGLEAQLDYFDIPVDVKAKIISALLSDPAFVEATATVASRIEEVASRFYTLPS